MHAEVCVMRTQGSGWILMFRLLEPHCYVHEQTVRLLISSQYGKSFIWPVCVFVHRDMQNRLDN